MHKRCILLLNAYIGEGSSGSELANLRQWQYQMVRQPRFCGCRCLLFQKSHCIEKALAEITSNSIETDT